MNILVIMLILLSYGKLLQADTSNLLSNGSFDNIPSNGIARGWKDNSGWADVKVKYSAEIDEAYSRKSQKIECILFRSGAVQFTQPGIRITKGRGHSVSIWMKGDVVSPVELLLRKPGTPYSTYFSKSFKVDTTWREYKFRGISEVDVPNALFMIRFTGTGTLWIDDAVFTETSADGSSAQPLIGNQVSNGSFEVGLDRWGINIRETGGYEFAMPVSMQKQQPVIDVNNKKVGIASLKITIPENGRFRLTSPYIKVNPGREYALSLWLSSDRRRNLRIGLGAGSFGNGTSKSKMIQIERGWNRYILSTVLPAAPEDAWFVYVEAEGDGIIWVDGVQLEEGSVTRYSSNKLAEIGLKREHTATLYESDEDVSLTAILSSEKGGRYSAVIRSVDYQGEEKRLWKGDIVLAPNERRELNIGHPTMRLGYHRLVAQVSRFGEVLDTSEMAIGIVSKRASGSSFDSYFGGHSQFNRRSLDEIKMLGVDWLRMHPPDGTKWFIVERTEGKFDYFDESILLAKSMGFSILGSLDTTPRWASTAPPDQFGQGANGYRSYEPENLEEWGDYVYQTVLHYKGIIDYWEVWNEPDSNSFLKLTGTSGSLRRPRVYTDLLKVAYREAKRANPNAVIVGGAGTGQPPEKWVEAIFKRGAYDYLDVLSFHFYTDGRPGDALDTPTAHYIDQLKALMRKYGKGTEKPIWESESGIVSPATSYKNILEVTPGYAVLDKDAVAYLIRNYVHLLASGVSKWFYYSMFTSHRIDRNETKGFFEWDGSPRPLALSYANLSIMIDKSKYNRPLRFDNGIVGEEFIRAGSTVKVLWSDGWSERKVQMKLPVSPSYDSATAYDVMGNLIERAQVGGELSLNLTKIPLFVVYRK